MKIAPMGHLIAGRGRWHLAVGDPNALAWIIVGAYAVAAGLSVWAFLAARSGQRRLASINPDEARNQRLLKRLWMLTAVTMLALGINKQLDLQTLLLQTLRDQAYRGGWYNRRREYQVAFILAVGIVGVIATISLAVAVRRVLDRVLLTVAGLGVLVSFVVIRAASFHYVDKVLSLGGQIRVNWFLEMSGILLIIVAALKWRWSERTLMALAVGDAVAVPSDYRPPSNSDTVSV
jgi:hypothetical protein